jgi:hyperosmotically inducible protein
LISIKSIELTSGGVLLALSVIMLGATAAGCGGGGSMGRPPVVRQSLDDAQLTTGVKSALLNDRQLGAQAIDVNVSQGVVTLSGVVRTDADAARAQQLARQVSGVKDVTSSIKVLP